ncbi:MAG: N-acetylmuramoyl-L-alanine amidase [Verrucomicrobia bacterium]|nr:N-acetylmuramoyl-L-alanine amidase [Verrucomicrobiota bacterium]
MPRSRKLPPSLLALGLIAALGLALVLWRANPPGKPPAANQDLALSALAQAPEWSDLKPFQHTIRRRDFEVLLTTVFTTGGAWRDLIRIDDREARISTGLPAPNDLFHLAFITTGEASPTPRYWRATRDLPPAPPGQPLAGLRLAIDPGHLGGAWATMEERRLVVGGNPPVCEGDLTLQVAKLLKPRLEALGATVSLVRSSSQPLTPLRPADLLTLATTKVPPADSAASPRKLAERLFYRTAEIHARARYVNQTLKPDLVLCLHFNADAWGNPDNPLMVSRSHLHLLVNGAYSDAEVALADQRFALLHKLLQRTHEEEVLVGASVADALAAATGLPPFSYSPNADNARPIPAHPYLWARNLLANRLYQCPVIFTEPYVMNSTTDYARIRAGDYAGLRQIAGHARPSIFREYADAIATGLAHHYSKHRQPKT